ncbi:hydrogenase maturation protease [Zobellella maritima]|uniref:hydrogenase maturation protease n=1 Tax=Zobellella maritima TaxID=2059725 RepID=UPI0013002CDE|nr:hydrogenase maturation protease [Zobellella maritima]
MHPSSVDDNDTVSGTKIRILFLGNPLHGDDAAGIRALELSQAFSWPAGVELIDGGTGGISLLPLFQNCRHIILVDAFLSPGEGGEVRLVCNVDHDLLADDRGLAHGGGIRGLLALVSQLVSPPPIIDLLAIGGCRFAPCRPMLTEKVARALPGLCRRLHCHVTEQLANAPR